MNGLRDSEAMRELRDIDIDALMREIARYLAAIDAFRAAACEPTWQPELVSGALHT